MRALYTRIAGRFKGLVLIQGSAPKARLVERFRQDGNAVLVATMSFWEGVDVPGRALRLVVIDKIPFAVPTDPLYQARAAHMEREGGNPFAQLAVPEAALTLKQGFGRLVRTASDAGVVALLDPRVVRRGYGKRILSTLPPATRSGTLDEVARFYARLFPSPGDASPPADATC
jgi:ATP-dependent DNA helicase DinG